MKSILVLLALCLAGCTAFTAPKDPVTGIRQDAPEHWVDSPNPLDDSRTVREWKHPLLTWQGRNAIFFGSPPHYIP